MPAAKRPDFMLAANGDPLQELSLTTLMTPALLASHVIEASLPKVRHCPHEAQPAWCVQERATPAPSGKKALCQLLVRED